MRAERAQAKKKFAGEGFVFARPGVVDARFLDLGGAESFVGGTGRRCWPVAPEGGKGWLSWQ